MATNTRVNITISTQVHNALMGFQRLSGAVSHLAGALGVAISGGALVRATKQAIDAADQMGKMASRLGVSVEAMSKFSFAAKLGAASTEQLETGLIQLNQKIAKGHEAFSQLGIAIRSSDGRMRSAEEVFRDIAQAFSQMPDGVEKTALAVQLFGESGAKLIPVLNGLEEASTELENMNAVIETRASVAAAKFNDRLAILQAGLGAVTQEMSERLLPTLTLYVDRMIESIRLSNVSNLVAVAVSRTITALAMAYEVLAAGIDNAVTAYSALWVAITTGDFRNSFGSAVDMASDRVEVLIQRINELTSALSGVDQQIDQAMNIDLEQGGENGVSGALQQANRDAVGFFERMRQNLEEMQFRWSYFGRNIADVMSNGVGRSIDAVSYGMWQVIDGTATWGSLFANVARGIISDTIRIVLQWVISQTIIRGLQRAFGAERTAMAQKEFAESLPGATAASISSYGAAAAIGIAALLAALAIGLTAFAKGGPVNGPTVALMGEAGQEFVVSNRGVQAAGLPFLHALNEGRIGDAGGLASAPNVNVGGANVNVAVLSTRAEVQQFLESAPGQKIMFDMIRRQKTELGFQA